MFLIPAITFILVISLILWFFIKSPGHYFIKSGLIVVGTWYSIAIAVTLPTILGWGSKTELPEKYEVFWIKINEPNKGDIKDEGSIEIWVQDISENPNKVSWWSLFAPRKKDTRLHILPYSRELHERARDAQKLLRQGKRVIGNNGKGGRGKGKGKGRGRGKGKLGPGGGEEGDKSVGPKFYVMPPIEMPPKN